MLLFFIVLRISSQGVLDPFNFSGQEQNPNK